jgi:uncharacterized membrane protein
MNTAGESRTQTETVTTDQRRLILTTGAILVIGSLGDFLFWQRSPGLSVGVFFFVLGTSLIGLGRRTLIAGIAACLLFASCVQSAIELCFTNIAALVLLTIVLFGETAFGGIQGKWARWSEALYATISGPLQWRDFTKNWADLALTVTKGESLNIQTLGRVFRATGPAAILAVIFTMLLTSGNAILAEAFSRFAIHVEGWLLAISFGRTVMWLVWLTVGLVFFWPKLSLGSTRWWTRRIPLFSRNDERLARWQSAMILGVVNALFFAANTVDVLYLWSNARLPDGIGYSEFVHRGVYSLIAAVLLAAATMAMLFQQPSIARNGILRGLAMLWIAQNFILILGVLRRLELYVEAYQLSELRAYVACFLALVTIGFILLAREIWSGMKLGRLFFGNAVATFALFFTLQFCDVGTWVANWNVSRWIKGEHPAIDLRYLLSLGARGWPGLSRIADNEDNAAMSALAKSHLASIAASERGAIHGSDWRSLQLRREARRAEIFARLKGTP